MFLYPGGGGWRQGGGKGGVKSGGGTGGEQGEGGADNNYISLLYCSCILPYYS